MKRGGTDLMAQCEKGDNRLEHPCRAKRVAETALGRADGGERVAENGHQAQPLGGVVGRGPGPVGMDPADIGGLEAGGSQGAPDGSSPPRPRGSGAVARKASLERP